MTPLVFSCAFCCTLDFSFPLERALMVNPSKTTVIPTDSSMRRPATARLAREPRRSRETTEAVTRGGSDDCCPSPG